MSELVERVARAIEDQMASDANHPDDLARAAIAAMREPTTEMEVEGTEAWLCEAAMEDRSRANWRAMVDAAVRDV